MDAVSFYLYNILTPTLQRYGVSDTFCNYITEIVELQMNSLLRRWDDIAFRKTVLLIGLEEGTFYEPASKIDIRCFVVMTIRNSPLETIQSDSFAKAGLRSAISDENLKSITSEAICYFSKQDFSKLCSFAKSHTTKDYYYDILQGHPVIATALKKIANTSSKTIKYESVPINQQYDLKGLNVISLTEKATEGIAISSHDGYTPALDPILAKTLVNFIGEENNAFVTDSFKSITRNFEKLISVLEFLLTRNISFVTTNFYLENGHAERRVKPLKAGHNKGEIQRNLRQTSELSHKHKNALKLATKHTI